MVPRLIKEVLERASEGIEQCILSIFLGKPDESVDFRNLLCAAAHAGPLPDAEDPTPGAEAQHQARGAADCNSPLGVRFSTFLSFHNVHPCRAKEASSKAQRADTEVG